VLHVIDESDYRFRVTGMALIEEIVKILRGGFKKLRGKSLPVYAIQSADLKDYQTTKEDFKKGYIKRPCDDELVFDEEFKGFSAYDENYGTESLQRKRQGSTIYSHEGEKVCKDDFEIKKILGVGSFGKVFLVRKVNSGTYYAMKALKKSEIIEQDSFESTKLEKKIMQVADHPFIVKMKYVFQTEDKLCFVMEFVRGGELYQNLISVKRFSET